MDEKRLTVPTAQEKGRLPTGFRELLPSDLSTPVFERIGREGMLVTVEDGGGHGNPMTATWGGFGVLFGENVFFLFVRASRYTHALLETTRTVTVSFLGEGARDILRFCGTHSGRDGDKTAATGLSPFRLPEGGISYETASLVLSGEVIYAAPLCDGGILDEGYRAYYKNGDYHTMFVSRVSAVYERRTE